MEAFRLEWKYQQCGSRRCQSQAEKRKRRSQCNLQIVNIQVTTVIAVGECLRGSIRPIPASRHVQQKKSKLHSNL
eukprot:scaffold10730_cov236-Chaetoceros_neogracile.AAC.2